jgi:rod shape-determining protein MreD|tara:strand:- start:1846 stop:2364 length:519 start_codon:yes stop_codon:yes gene_type:complete
MVKFQKNKITNQLLKSFPIILLFVSVLNEFDFNYLNLKYFSFNFPFILVFYWSLKKNESLGYGFIFIAGLFNDAVVGLPIGLSSLSYLLVCGFAAYLRNITLRPDLIKDWLFFLMTICVTNSLIYFLIVVFFKVNLNYLDYVFNIIFTFLFYLVIAYIFDIYQRFIFKKEND